ncbi:MAG: sulfite exporter TauE/SafE family protein, partial [Pseudomonadota bacterium]
MVLPFAPFELLWIGFALLFAGFVKGATGLGYSTTSLPLLALVIGLKPALPLVLAPSLASNLVVLAGVR